jgi:hypothetical protein
VLDTYCIPNNLEAFLDVRPQLSASVQLLGVVHGFGIN